MFRKKHSEINIKVPLQTYSPLRSKQTTSPFTRRQDDRNLSPLKNHNRSPNARTPRKQFLPKNQVKTPTAKENTFQNQLEQLSFEIETQFSSSKPVANAHFGYKTENTSDSKLTDRFMKQSKKLFTKCIFEMNSEKRRPNTQVSNNLSANDNNKQPSDCAVSNKSQIQNAKSFKDLKIQMIDSVLPQHKSPSEKKLGIQLRKMDSGSNHHPMSANEKGNEVKGFFTEEKKNKDQMIELINESFSAAKPSPVVEEWKQFVENLGQKGKLLESVDEQEMSDYIDFDLIMQKVQITPVHKKKLLLEQSVNVSIECAKGGLTMDPFL